MTLKPVQKAPHEILPFSDPRIKYPMFASRKFDGFRAVFFGPGNLYTSSMKKFPNRNLNEHFNDLAMLLESSSLVIDAELWSPDLEFHQMQSCFMSHGRDIPTSVQLYVFDMLSHSEWNSGDSVPFHERYFQMTSLLRDFPGVVLVEQRYVHTPDEAQTLYDKAIENGWEGLMLRSPYIGYEHRRCNRENDSVMFKFKNRIPEDAVIIDVVRAKRLKAGVERKRNSVSGLLERPYCDDCYEDDDKIAGFVVETKSGIICSVGIGKGFTDEDKTLWWQKHCEDPTHFYKTPCEITHMPHGSHEKLRMGKLTKFRFDLKT